MGKFLKLTALLVFLPAVLFAGAETGGDVLKERTGVRATAMAGAYTAVANDVEALNYNPAGIASVTKRELEVFSFLSGMNYAGSMVVYGAFAQPFESPLLDGFVGLSAVYRAIPDIANDDAKDDPLTIGIDESLPVSYYDMALTGSYACSLYQFIKDDFFKTLSFGISAKLIFEQIGQNRGSTIGFDAGLIFVPADSAFRFGLALLNAGFPLKIIRGNAQPGDPELSSDPLPMTLRGGIAYKIDIDKNNSTLFSADYIHDFYESGQAAIGIEHSLLNILFLRLGYNMSADTRNPSAITAGAGINITTLVPIELTVGFNYAYRLVLWNWFNAPDSTHAMSLMFKF